MQDHWDRVGVNDHLFAVDDFLVLLSDRGTRGNYHGNEYNQRGCNGS